MTAINAGRAFRFLGPLILSFAAVCCGLAFGQPNSPQDAPNRSTPPEFERLLDFVGVDLLGRDDKAVAGREAVEAFRKSLPDPTAFKPCCVQFVWKDPFSSDFLAFHYWPSGESLRGTREARIIVLDAKGNVAEVIEFRIMNDVTVVGASLIPKEDGRCDLHIHASQADQYGLLYNYKKRSVEYLQPTSRLPENR